MAHLATRKFSYWGQGGILIGLVGAGLIIGIIASALPLLGAINFSDLMKGKDSQAIMDAIMKPENANALRIAQFLSTLFIFFVPCWIYAIICHKKPVVHFGFNKKPLIQQLALVLAIMLFSLFIIGALQEVWSQIPFPKEWKAVFKKAEDEYMKQMLVIGRMNGIADFIFSLFVIALLPAIFEEVAFRGALQNLLSRAMNGSVWAVVITSVLFSAIHFSYDGFVARVMLGFVLGWMYYRTGNLWLPVFGHFVNNAIGVITLYAISKPGQPVDLNKLNEQFPIWLGVVGIIAVIGLLTLLEKISKKDIDRPGQETVMFDYNDPNNPFIAENDNVVKP